jgi:hypothetical protein
VARRVSLTAACAFARMPDTSSDITAASLAGGFKTYLVHTTPGKKSDLVLGDRCKPLTEIWRSNFGEV